MKHKTAAPWQIRAAEYCQRLGGVARRLKHYRCGSCYSRRSLKQELWQYLRPPHCTVCGAVNWTIDLARTREYIARKGVFDTCYCSQLPHPHRRGSVVWCVDHPKGPTEEDYIDRHGLM